ncbi:hypothetical protein CO666_08765 [Rhizobium chutanense]|uniref:Uncharacterized protein n=1 Tax=Rhizobium chutanense TaxID=2035448 RepID=A0A2A6JEV1_9HYPH|nr:hypothetical protein [Rhizobium chutanense]PDT04817.1 hypothetical protein CO666_08765 [Rhizobium chutanense]
MMGEPRKRFAYGRGEAACADLVEAWLGDAAERNGCFVMERDYAFTMRENRADVKYLAEFPRI